MDANNIILNIEENNVNVGKCWFEEPTSIKEKEVVIENFLQNKTFELNTS